MKKPGLVRSVSRAVLNTPLRLLRWLGIWLLAGVLLFEEWGWEQLAALMAWLGRWPGIRHFEQLIRRLPPYGALALFMLPVLGLLPVKLLALYWIGQGHAASGIAVIITAKVVGTAIVARLFSLTHPTLMRLAWFERLFLRWMRFKTRVLDHVHQSAAWRHVQGIRAALRGLKQRLLAQWQRWRR